MSDDAASVDPPGDAQAEAAEAAETYACPVCMPPEPAPAQKKKRKRILVTEANRGQAKTADQISMLRTAFARQRNYAGRALKELAEKVDLEPHQVSKWLTKQRTALRENRLNWDPENWVPENWDGVGES